MTTCKIYHPDKGFLVKYDPEGSIWSENEDAGHEYDMDHAEKLVTKLPGSSMYGYFL